MRELTIQTIQEKLAAGEMTVRGLVETYLARIEAIDRDGPRLNAVIEVNPDALAIADALDEKSLGPGQAKTEHNQPGDRPEHRPEQAGSGAAARRAGADQGQHRHGGPDEDRRRIAGAGGLDRGARCFPRRAAARGRRGDPGQDQPQRVGQLPLDPLDQRLEQPRRADAQPLCAGPQPVRLQLRLGGGGGGRSVRASPSAPRPTARSSARPTSTASWASSRPSGLVSRAGIIPIAHSQDTAGPMARTVADAAMLLGVLAEPVIGQRTSATVKTIWSQKPISRSPFTDYRPLPRPGRPARGAHRRGAQLLRLQPAGRCGRGGRVEALRRRWARSWWTRPTSLPDEELERDRAGGAALRVQGRPQRLSGRAGPGRAGQFAGRGHRFQRGQPRPGDALLSARRSCWTQKRRGR